jgi:hypothetical protein
MPKTTYNGPHGKNGVNSPIAAAPPAAENLDALKRALAVRRFNTAGLGTFLSKPNAIISITATITHGNNTAGESKNHFNGCLPNAPQIPPITPYENNRVP